MILLAQYIKNENKPVASATRRERLAASLQLFPRKKNGLVEHTLKEKTMLHPILTAVEREDHILLSLPLSEPSAEP